MRFVDPTGMLTDDYYNLINGKYLGSDAFGTSPRLIDSGLYSSITGGKTMTKNLSSIERLRDNSTTISVDWNQIEEHAQSVADLSRESRLEHQAILVLDREKAKVTSVLGPVGTNSHAEIPHFPAPVTGVSFYDRPGGLIIIGEIHGHPASEKAGMSTEHTMSPDFDVPLAKKMQIPIYGIDAMYGKTEILCLFIWLLQMVILLEMSDRPLGITSSVDTQTGVLMLLSSGGEVPSRNNFNWI